MFRLMVIVSRPLWRCSVSCRQKNGTFLFRQRIELYDEFYNVFNNCVKLRMIASKYSCRSEVLLECLKRYCLTTKVGLDEPCDVV